LLSSPLDTQPPEVQEALQSLLSTAMHKAGKFALLNLAGGFAAKRTLLVTAIPRYQKTNHPKRPVIKLPTMELAKLTRSLFGQRQPRRTFAVAKGGESWYTMLSSQRELQSYGGGSLCCNN